MLKRTLLATLILGTFSSQTLASVEVHTKPETCDATNVSRLSGSDNLSRFLNEWTQNINTNTNDTTNTIETGTNQIIEALVAGVADVNTTNAQASHNQLQREAEMLRTLADTQAAFEMEMLENRRRENLGLTPNETKEEIDLILDFLELGQEQGLTVRETQLLIMSQLDEDNTMTIGVPTHSGNLNCSEEQIANNECVLPRKITPHLTMMAYYQQCSENKIQEESNRRVLLSQTNSITDESKRIVESVNNNDPELLIQQRQEENSEILCTPELKIAGYCGQDISEEEFQYRMASQVIIPNGNISPTNAFTPTGVGGIEYGLELSGEEIEALEYNSVDRSTEEEVNQDIDNIAPIVYTYRNANQLKAALSFVETMVNDTLVANQDERFRNLPRSAEFQARYTNRLASLNLVRSAFRNSVQMRTGRTLSGIQAGLNEDYSSLEDIPDNHQVKESSLGAGELDLLIHQINQSYREISISQSGQSPIDQLETIEGSNEKHWLLKNYEMINLQNQVLLQQMLQNERTELIRAAQLQQLINSPENVQYLESLRGQ